MHMKRTFSWVTMRVRIFHANTTECSHLSPYSSCPVDSLSLSLHGGGGGGWRWWLSWASGKRIHACRHVGDVKRKTTNHQPLYARHNAATICERVFYNGKFLVWYVVGKTQVCHTKNKISRKVGKLNCAFVRKRKINECCWRHFIFLNLQHSCRLGRRTKKIAFI